MSFFKGQWCARTGQKTRGNGQVFGFGQMEHPVVATAKSDHQQNDLKNTHSTNKTLRHWKQPVFV